MRWDDLNFDTGEMRLPDTKTGTRLVPLVPAVARVFDDLSRTPGSKMSARMTCDTHCGCATRRPAPGGCRSSPAARQVLTALPRRSDNPWVFPRRVRGTRLHP